MFECLPFIIQSYYFWFWSIFPAKYHSVRTLVDGRWQCFWIKSDGPSLAESPTWMVAFLQLPTHHHAITYTPAIEHIQQALKMVVWCKLKLVCLAVVRCPLWIFPNPLDNSACYSDSIVWTPLWRKLIQAQFMMSQRGPRTHKSVDFWEGNNCWIHADEWPNRIGTMMVQWHASKPVCSTVFQSLTRVLPIPPSDSIAFC